MDDPHLPLRQRRATRAAAWTLLVVPVTMLAACAGGPDLVGHERISPPSASTVAAAAADARPGPIVAPTTTRAHEPSTSTSRSTSPTASKSTSSTTSVASAGGRTPAGRDLTCAAVLGALDTLTQLAGQPTAAAMQAAIGPAREEILRAAVSVSVDVRQAVETVAALLAAADESGTAARSAAATRADPEIIGLVDELIVEVDHLLLGPGSLLGMLPELLERCPAAIDHTAFIPLGPQPFARAHEIRDRLDELGARQIADDFLPPDLLDAADRDPTVALSGLQPEFQRCAFDAGAQTYGDNTGCDALHDACDARNLLACNDLYWVATSGSDYESFAASCGRRTSFGGPGYAGSCEQLG